MARSMMRCLKSSKLRHPDPPTSTTVVTPERGATTSGIDAVVAGVRSRLAGAGVHMRVNVDEAGADEEPWTIDRFHGIRRIDLRRDGGDLSAGDRHVPNGADAVSRIDEVAAAKQQVVSRRREHVRTADAAIQTSHERSRRPGTILLRAFSVFHLYLVGSASWLTQRAARTPLRAQILAHVELARHLVARSAVPVNVNGSESPLCPP